MKVSTYFSLETLGINVGDIGFVVDPYAFEFIIFVNMIVSWYKSVSILILDSLRIIFSQPTSSAVDTLYCTITKK